MSTFTNEDKTKSIVLKSCEIYRDDYLLILFIDNKLENTDFFSPRKNEKLYYLPQGYYKFLPIIPVIVEESPEHGGVNDILIKDQIFVHCSIIPQNCLTYPKVI